MKAFSDPNTEVTAAAKHNLSVVGRKFLRVNFAFESMWVPAPDSNFIIPTISPSMKLSCIVKVSTIPANIDFATMVPPVFDDILKFLIGFPLCVLTTRWLSTPQLHLDGESVG